LIDQNRLRRDGRRRAEHEHGRPAGLPGQLTLFVFMACLVAATGCLIFGYDIGISGGVTSMDPLLRKFYPSVYGKQQEADDSN
jgi:hypothetical protein